MTIQEQYNQRRSVQTDINEHLETLYSYGVRSDITSITEMGTRFGDSTIAFLNAIENTNKTLFSYDLFRSENISGFERYKNYKFFQEDTLACNIINTDILFIDTLHTYFQLHSELTRHSKQVNKFIILHDTETFGVNDEVLYSSDCAVKMSDLVILTERQGLRAAFTDFLANETDGINWRVKETFTNNNGLVILERI